MRRATSPFNRLVKTGRKVEPIGRMLDNNKPHHRSDGQAIYQTKEWQTLTNRLRKAKPYCSKCGVTGVRLFGDHVTELKDGGAAFDPSNVQILCGSCHRIKTEQAKVDRGWRQQTALIAARLGGGHSGEGESSV